MPPSTDRRRTVELRARCAEAALLARGFVPERIVNLARAGLATVETAQTGACQLNQKLTPNLCAFESGGYRPRMPKLRMPSADRRRALELLAKSVDGCTEAVLLGRDFTPQLVAELIKAGLATVRPERMIVVGNAVSVTRIKITESGREVLEGR